jgi:bifunctional DNA-binding transcriptional regulator/antitoxin component of YhaV-PrlF toxin-antitoxin module
MRRAGEQPKWLVVSETTNGRVTLPLRDREAAEWEARRLVDTDDFRPETRRRLGTAVISPDGDVTARHGRRFDVHSPPAFPPLRSARSSRTCTICGAATDTGLHQEDHGTCPPCTYQHVDEEERPVKLGHR